MRLRAAFRQRMYTRRHSRRNAAELKENFNSKVRAETFLQSSCYNTFLAIVRLTIADVYIVQLLIYYKCKFIANVKV